MPWLHYRTADGSRVSSLNDPIDDSLLPDGMGQIWSDIDNDYLAVDITQNPHVVIQLQPPPTPSPTPGG